MPSPRQPVCIHCNHPRSFHANGTGTCKALGCKGCSGYAPKIVTQEAVDAE